MVSVAARRSILVGGPKKVGGAARAAKRIFSKIPEKISFYPQNFLMTFFIFFSQRKLQKNNYAAMMASAVRRKIIGGSAAINKSRRRWRPQIVGGHAARPAHGSTPKSTVFQVIENKIVRHNLGYTFVLSRVIGGYRTPDSSANFEVG